MQYRFSAEKYIAQFNATIGDKTDLRYFTLKILSEDLPT